jgi:hypothetical protein
MARLPLASIGSGGHANEQALVCVAKGIENFKKSSQWAIELDNVTIRQEVRCFVGY